MLDLEVFVATHKSTSFPDDPCYMPISVGSAVRPDLGLKRDDVGDNISAKAPFYCEVAVLYWIWKNTTSKNVGLMHYRRYLASRHQGVHLQENIIASGDDFLDELHSHNMIVADPLRFYYPQTEMPMSVEQQFAMYHNAFDLIQVRNVLRTGANDYVETFDFVMRNNILHPWNIFVSTREVFDAYCRWFFPIIFEIENLVQPQHIKDPQQARAIGFISERLFTVWIAHHRTLLRIGTRRLVFYENL